MRGRRRARAVAAGALTAALVAVAAVLTATGGVGPFGRAGDPASVPEWDTTQDFRFALGEGTYPRLEVVREAGADGFTVRSTISTPTDLDRTPVATLPGSELFTGPGVNVLLTPAPPDLEAGDHYWVPSTTDQSAGPVYGTSRVADHHGQALLVQVLVTRWALSVEDLGDVVWVVDDTVGLASGAPVHQAELGSGEDRIVVWRSPQAGLVGYVTSDPDRRLWATELADDHLYSVSVRTGEGSQAGRSRQWRLAVLPGGATDVTSVLDDSVGTVMPFETAALGPETLAYRLLDGVDVARGPSGHAALSWTTADGARQDLSGRAPTAREGTQARQDRDGAGATSSVAGAAGDSTTGPAFELGPAQTGLGAPLRLRREAGPGRFSVTLLAEEGDRALQPVPGRLPGPLQLYAVDDGLSVLVTPLPEDVDPGEVRLLGAAPESRGHVAPDPPGAGQRLLVHVLRPDARAESVVDVLWVRGGRVATAGGAEVLSAPLEGAGEGAVLFVVPEHGVGGALLPWSAVPLQVAPTGEPRLLSLAVGSVGPGRIDDERLLLALLPDGATEPAVRLADRDGTPLPLAATPLGGHTVAAAIVQGVDVAVEDGRPALSWTAADGTQESLARSP